MKFKRNRFFIVLFCIFVCFLGLVYKTSDSAGQSCTPTALCTDCHIVSLCSSQGFYLREVDSSVEKHELSSGDDAVVLITAGTPPPDPDLLPHLVLGGALYCTDCHEDHDTPTPNVFQLKSNVNNRPVQVAITEVNAGVCTLGMAGTGGNPSNNKALGWLCRTCHKDDSWNPMTPTDYNRWSQAHHYLRGGSDFPYNRTACYNCHTTSAGGTPINCECCHYHGAMTTDYGANYPCYLNSSICRTPYDRRNF